MPKRRIEVRAPSGQAVASPRLQARFDAIRAELDVPGGFPREVLAEAERVSGSPPAPPHRDETARPFITIDPPGSMDLDQALCIERERDGYRVRYAIADVPAFVVAGEAIDVEARRRGQTIYAPDRRTPLHPTVLSEGAASLLPGQVAPAFVWDMRLDPEGECAAVDVYRALVRSTGRLSYAGAQQAVDDGTDDERMLLLKEVGLRRIELERRRGGASLPLPEQEVTEDGHGRYRLGFRPPLAVEDWNAQISLMTGMAAAGIMLGARVGILRTLPAPEPDAIARFRRASRVLGAEWHDDTPYGEFLRKLDRADPRHLALIHEATGLFRGAGYTPFVGEVPAEPEHAALAAPYAHVTAPLRRLVDRFGLAICEAVTAGREVPDWAVEALPSLPDLMEASDRKAVAVERACSDAVEAAALEHRVGGLFAAIVVDRHERGGVVVQIDDPAVLAVADGTPRLGESVTVKLVTADVDTGEVRFRVES